jgi:hypothetical protein
LKTQILQLEPFDDAVSIRDRMNWSKTPRILLVFPRRRRIKLSRLDLVLLRRHAASLGAQLGLVTRSPAIRREAKKLGISVFHSILDAERSPWEPRPRPIRRTRPRRRNLRALREKIRPASAAWTQSPVARLVFFTIGVAAVLALAAAFFPRAEVTLNLRRRTQSLTLSVRANPEVSDVFLSGSIPARQTSIVLETTRTVYAHGTTELPLAAAKGVARFRNLTEVPVLVPRGTVIRSEGVESIRFETTQEQEIPAEGIADIPIRAMEFGEAGNLPPDSLRIIVGTLELSLSVTNPDPTTGGESRIVSAPNDEDRERVREVALNELKRKSLSEIRSALPDGSILFPQSVALVDIVEETYTPADDAPSETLTLHLKAKVQAEYAAAEDVRDLARRSLEVTLPEGFSPAPGSLSIESITTPTLQADGSTTWQIRASQDLLPTISRVQILSCIQGRTADTAAARLEDLLPLASPPKIEISPSFFPYLPLAPFRITLIFP